MSKTEHNEFHHSDYVSNKRLPKLSVYISSVIVFIMPKVRRTSYNTAFKLKVVAEAKAVENNSEIARDYGISESMVRRWRRDQAKLFNGELKMSAKRTTLGRFTPKYSELDQQMLEWFSDQREQGEYSSLHVKSDKHFV